MEQQTTVSTIITTGEALNKEPKEPVAELIEAYPLRSFWLSYWLWQHRIPETVTRNYCKEVHYKLGEKEYAAIGFPNQAGGWLIRNRYHHLHIGTAGPTHLAHGSKHLAVFTDFIDLLTLISILGMTNPQLPDLLLLSPTDGVTSLRHIETIYYRVHLFCQNNYEGNRLTEAALRHSPPCIDQRRLYSGYKNLNDWARHFGKRNPATFPG